MLLEYITYDDNDYFDFMTAYNYMYFLYPFDDYYDFDKVCFILICLLKNWIEIDILGWHCRWRSNSSQRASVFGQFLVQGFSER
jgi:hypothetical protein